MNIIFTNDNFTIVFGNIGPQGPPGIGVPSGGTTGQVLTKNSNSNYDTSWENGGSGSAAWGSIGGNIQNQTDLQNEFNSVIALAVALS